MSEPGTSCHGKHPTSDAPTSIQLRLIMTDRTLFGDDDEPAQLHGYGQIPGPIARAILAREVTRQQKRWIKRLYTDPTGQHLLTMDSRARLFPPGVADFILNRDQICRTPWCDAPIRQLDHITRYADGGPTSTANAQGLCQACNLAKEIPDWTSTPAGDGIIAITTPTEHVNTSYPPRPPHSEAWDKRRQLPHGWIDIVTLHDLGYRRVA